MILFTFIMILVIVPVIGLAIDGSIVMWEKARLATAVDAAALAAGRSLSAGQDLASQTTSAVNMAQTYFNANFQPGQMGTTVVNGPTVTIAQSAASATRTVTIQANVNVPLYFLRLLGFTTASLQDSGQASRRDVNVMLVLDRSGSMDRSGSCKPMITAAQSFTNVFVDGRDQLGLVTFQTTGKVDYTPTTTFKSSSLSLSSVLGQLVCAGGTGSAEALSLAYKQIQNSGWIGALNVVVFFSDGWPNAITFDIAPDGTDNRLPVITQDGINQGQTDQRYGWSDYNTPHDTVPSSCASPVPMAGVFMGYATTTYDPRGYTLGVLSPSPISINSSAGNTFTAINAQGCSFTDTSDYGNNSVQLGRQDVAYLPSHDKYGNPTSMTISPSGLIPPFRPVDLFYYGGSLQIRPDTPSAIDDASFVAADNAAYKIRYDPKFSTVIYSIGLGSLVDNDFMERIANDPRASSYDSAKPAGQYYYAPSAAQLNTIFQQIASQVLRISQ